MPRPTDGNVDIRRHDRWEIHALVCAVSIDGQRQLGMTGGGGVTVNLQKYLYT